MSCMLAKIHSPVVDPREPYTEIGSETCFSGRTYDEQYITTFIPKYNLPCNNTTAYLTPAFRNHNTAVGVGNSTERASAGDVQQAATGTGRMLPLAG